MRPARLTAGLFLPFLAGTTAPGTAQSRPPLPADGQAATEFIHESWTVEDGLPVNAVTGLLQSRDGYLWIATLDGLVRFDGARFVVFSTSNTPELPSSRIADLWETRDGTLWLNTDQGQLVRFQDGVFLHVGAERGLNDAVGVLYEDASGRVWVGTDRGVGVIAGDHFAPVAAESIRAGVWAIIQRKDGSVWVGQEGGELARIEGEAVTQAIAGVDRTIVALHEDPLGTLWIGTVQGLWRYRETPVQVRTDHALGFRTSPRTGELWVRTAHQVLRIGPEGPLPVVPPTPSVYRSSQVLVRDAGGHMLYGSGPELHREGRRIFTLPPDANGQYGEPQRITVILSDGEGSIWLGTFAAGLHRIKPAFFTVYGEPEGISSPNVYSVFEDREGAVWIGTLLGGVHRLADGRITRLAEAAGYPTRVFSFLHDRQGRFWLGGGGARVHVCASPGGRCAPTGPERTTNVHAMHEDPDGTLWFGTTQGYRAPGLLRLDGSGWHQLTETEGAPAARVRAFLRTADGALWMGTNGGGLARHYQGRFRLVTTADGLPSDLIRSLYQDADGWLWVGTEGRGLVRLDPLEWQEGQRGRIVSYRMTDGLYDEVIHQILEDQFGRLWMSTNRGIFWVAHAQLLDFAEGRAPRINSVSYTERDGLRNREANGGSQPAGIRTRDGRLWFATQDGVAVVDPARIQQNLRPPPVVIEQVRTGDAALQPRGGLLELGVEQRDLEIDYTALSFLAPANVRFRYRLEPYDRDWLEAGGRRTAYYTRVPPGRYTFRVTASNNDGVWNEEGAAIELKMAPRFHETGAALALLVFTLGLLAIGGFRWRLRSLRLRERELMGLVEVRTAELREHQEQLAAQNEQLAAVHQARSRLFANLSHEFRTPLTLILGPLRSLLDGRHGRLLPSAREQGELMQRSGHRLLRLINQILDLSKLQTGAVTLDRRTHDLVGFARAATFAFTPLAERRGIALRFQSTLSELPAAFDAEQLEKVLLNLLSNALKFTERGGTVSVAVGPAAVGPAAGVAEIVVRDTGVGIAPDELPHVFERFYQVDASATRRYEGTGIGLALAKELVELHGGEIHAASTPGEGSTFTVRLPLIPQGRGSSPVHAVQRQREEGREHGVQAGSGGIPDEDLEATLSLDGADAPAPTAPPEPVEDRTTVLVVDDNADVRAYVRSVLSTSFRVLEACDGRAALEAARAALPDLIVADVMMPELDGLALARALQDDVMTDAIPIILLTARAAPEDQVAGLETGADAYLVKPFDPDVLEAQVANLLAQRRRLRERFARGEAVPPAPPTAAEPSALEQRLRPLVEAHLAESDFRPEELAAAAGLSYHQLYRALRDELDTSPSRFIRAVRVECAAELLRQGAGSVTEIAYSVGFESLSYFSRAFRERFGATPSAFLGAPAAPPPP